MSDSEQTIGMGSPKGSPPSMAIRPRGLNTERLEKEHDTARRVSAQLKDDFEALQSKVEPYVAPDQELPELDHKASLQLASLGIELASQEKKTILLERALIESEHAAGFISPQVVKKRLRDANQRYISAGDDLWRHQKKKMRLADPDPEEVPILDLRRPGVSECLLALYRKSDGLGHPKRRPTNWRRDALTYYNANGADHGHGINSVWCHVSGRCLHKDDVKAAHIVPFFLDFEGIGEVLFGERAQSLGRAGNALLMSKRIKDIICSSIMNENYNGEYLMSELDGKELTFHNEKRPVSRFLYFHFVMALVRIKDIKRNGWQDIWAKYYEQRPFPTPGPYLRKSMLMALASHFETTDLKVVDSWIDDYGFDTPLRLTKEEVMETARRVHLAVEERAIRAEDGHGSDDESDNGLDNNDSSEEEE
ncbi:hypothetical protein C2857_002115 [Epichloe festucae Fl1]|uniref:HNH nuclease domain-containing protein n=1 Tax=Epichloe festucae (strain Fl1) TaxID=877507 RepID=A0A7U3Q175_EPIFF|nr:hypothetical protein C2857_002115 [Epichloe festucae Fl1]